ncbi:hypothetical protein [Nocardioides sp. YIM 152588]|uniref:type 4a pilus biogenesis protein PilO n=1 Tax=Nocardioides sp. YIM 152588 TaxID=3158259 RepID=UPI0032E3E3DD
MNLRTVPGTLAVGLGALLLFLAASWFLAIGPVLGQTSDTRESIDLARDRNDVLRAQVATLKAQQDELPRYRAVADQMAALFPPTAEQPRYFAAVHEAARKAGIPADQVTALNPSAPELLAADGRVLAVDATATDAEAPTAEVGEQEVSVSVQGRYDQVQRFLANLETMERAFLVTSVGLEGGDETGAGEVTVTLLGNTYVATRLRYDPPATAPDPQSTQ